LSCASGAAAQHGVAAPDMAPDFTFKNYLSCASGATLQQVVAAPDRAPEFLYILSFIYFNSFELCIRYRTATTNISRGTRHIFEYI
jgi:hypothetical protein